ASPWTILSHFIGSAVDYRIMKVSPVRVRSGAKKESEIQTGSHSKVGTDSMSSLILLTMMFFMPKVRRASSIESICAMEKSANCDQKHPRHRSDIAFIGMRR